MCISHLSKHTDCELHVLMCSISSFLDTGSVKL